MERRVAEPFVSASYSFPPRCSGRHLGGKTSPPSSQRPGHSGVWWTRRPMPEVSRKERVHHQEGWRSQCWAPKSKGKNPKREVGGDLAGSLVVFPPLLSPGAPPTPSPGVRALGSSLVS